MSPRRAAVRQLPSATPALSPGAQQVIDQVIRANSVINADECEVGVICDRESWG